MRMDRLIVDGICERAKQIIDSAEFPINMDMLEKLLSELEEDVYEICYERKVLHKEYDEERSITIVFASCDMSMIIWGSGKRKSSGNYSIYISDDRPFRYVKDEKDGVWKNVINA